MLSVKGVYENGEIKFQGKVPAFGEIPVIVTFLEEEDFEKRETSKLNLNKFSFKRAKKILKNYKGSLSEAVIKERRSSI